MTRTASGHSRRLRGSCHESKETLAKLATEMQRLKAIDKEMLASPDQQISLTDPDSRSMRPGHWFLSVDLRDEEAARAAFEPLSDIAIIELR